MREEAAALLRWYDAGHRTMPWRGSRDPYAIWVSETMLQQTRVETVIPYYHRFLAAFPDVRALAEADTEEVLKRWEGLGYYQRARNLQAGARQVMAEYGGRLPETAAELAKIKGIGPYTAGAVASIAFGRPEPAVDGNVIRVISRLTGLRENVGVPSVRRRLTETVRGLIPPERPGDFNQALMDLGAGLCCPGTPDCDACPLRAFCDACAAGDADLLPYLPDKAPPKQEAWAVLIAVNGAGEVLLAPRRERLLQGLWCFPMLPGTPGREEIRQALRKNWGLEPGQPAARGEARHVFTHRVWNMTLWVAPVAGGAPEGWRFCGPEEAARLPMPTAVKAARALALREGLTKPGSAHTVSKDEQTAGYQRKAGKI